MGKVTAQGLFQCLYWTSLESAPERERDGRGRGKKNTRKTKNLTNLPGHGLAHGPWKCESAVWVPRLPVYDWAFLCRERSLSRKLSHGNAQAHTVVSASAAQGRCRQRVSFDKNCTNNTRTGPNQRGLVHKRFTKSKHFFFLTAHQFI